MKFMIILSILISAGAFTGYYYLAALDNFIYHENNAPIFPLNSWIENERIKSYAKIGFAIGIGIFHFPNIWMGLLFWIVLELTTRFIKRIRIERQISVFNSEGYKIYRYLAIQMTSGLRASEILKNIHQSVENKNLKKAIIALSNAYLQTMDFDIAATAFKSHFNLQEANVLLTVIRQSLEHGNAYEMVKNQEQLMVSRYFNALEVYSQNLKLKGVILTILLCLILFIMLAIPLMNEMINASQTIFL